MIRGGRRSRTAIVTIIYDGPATTWVNAEQ